MFSFLELITIIVIALTILPFISLAPFAPTRGKDLKRVHRVLKLKPTEKFLEIGCGTGRVSLYLAKNNQNSEIVGIEFSLGLFIIAKIKAYLSQLDNIKIIYGNALNHDFGYYEALYIFGMEKALETKILPKLKKEMKENAKLVSYCFRIESWKGKETKYKENKEDLAMYEYMKSG